ncbi:MAG TPA: thiamine pyrophosphate-binding protein [Pseudonocardiaceae bacterium]|jgi:acetolactate synthase-1/2/3 large subunit|nr:thiamine pyrophosphate-binding protein [Pseudonocardiaceae bacterium]
MGLTGAQIITDYLVRERVPYAVGLCGHGDLGLLDGLVERQDEISTISVHHESIAGFMADAYYRVAHQPLATFTSCGPGSANMPIAMGSALMDDSAFLAITGNVATSQFNRGPFQEAGRHFQADFPTAARPYVKRSFQATRAEQLPLMLRQAFAQLRGGRPGPVHLDVPLDVFVERTDEPVPEPAVWGTDQVSTPAAGRAELDAACALIRDCARVLIVAGSGVAGSEAEAELLAFARANGFPVATSPLGKATFPSSDPLSLGSTGRNGTFQANHAARTADLVLAFGTRFDDRATSSWLPGYTYSFPPTKLVHVHIDAVELGRNFPPTVGIQASPREVLRQLSERTPDFPAGAEVLATRRRWLADLAAARDRWARHIEPHEYSGATPIRPERVLSELRDALPGDGVLLSDVGVHHNWIVQNWRTDAPRTLLQSWGFAAMGFGVGGVLGAQLAAPDRPSVAVVGDGGFLMFPSAVATAVEYDIPAVWIVWNNGGFVSIRDQQSLYFGASRQLATSFRHAKDQSPYSPDFAALARGMGAEGLTVTEPADLGSAFKTALDLHRPVVVDVRVDDAVGMPSAATWALPPLAHPEPSFGWPEA